MVSEPTDDKQFKQTSSLESAVTYLKCAKCDSKTVLIADPYSEEYANTVVKYLPKKICKLA